MQATDQAEQGGTIPRAATDSLAMGLVFMLSLTVVQRLVGFLRSILFCGMLQDDELGRWSLAFSFLLLAGPLAVAGLPGSFGRYVEHFRSRRQLGTFLRRTLMVSLALVTLTIAILVWWGSFWAWLVLGDPALAPTMRLLAMALITVIAFNFVTELLTAMRKVRAVAIMQFVCSILFAVLAIMLLHFTDLRADGVIIAFGVASLLAVLVVVSPLRDVHREAETASRSLSDRRLWSKLVPFAAWIWLTNILANLFDAADRFMIIHLAREGATSAESLVGQYHSSRVVPYLLVSITTIVAGVVLPYLSQDWEAGRRDEVSRRHCLTLKLGGLLLTASGLLILLSAPLLFTWILRGKYEQGMAVLPWTVTYCIWFSMIMLAQNYLFCAEKARLGTLAFFLGLVANLSLNILLLPRFGLVGAIIATATGNALALGLIAWLSVRSGLAADRGVFACCALPGLLVLGLWPATCVLLGLAYLALRHHWLFNAAERAELAQVIAGLTERFKGLTYRRQVAAWRT